MLCQPRNNLIVVKAEKAKAQRESKAGIIIPIGGWTGEISEKALEGIVLAIGKKVTDVRPGDRIIYSFFSIKQKLNDDEFLMRERDVLGVIE